MTTLAFRLMALVFGMFFVNVVLITWVVSPMLEPSAEPESMLVMRSDVGQRVKQTKVGNERNPPREPTKTTATAAVQSSARKKNRLPSYGTPEFKQSCGWTLEKRTTINTTRSCTILARPPPNGREGISAWIGQIVTAFVMAKQTGCSFAIDYAAGIDISDIWIPTDPSVVDWRVPSGMDCQEDCIISDFAYMRGGGPRLKNVTKGFLAAVPSYRSPYGSNTNFENQKGYVGLKKTLGPSFLLQTSMACAFSSLIRLSPAATKYQPDLFSTLLPTLQDPNALVLTLYIRTGHTENLKLAERVEEYRNRSTPIINCALNVEGMMKNNHPKVVWMLVTDSQDLKTWISSTYSDSRTILTTQTRGAHTKTSGGPSTADFAEGILDWYLIGEADAVISDTYAPSFGNTGAFRGPGPYYKVQKDNKEVCNVEERVYKW